RRKRCSSLRRTDRLLTTPRVRGARGLGEAPADAAAVGTGPRVVLAGPAAGRAFLPVHVARGVGARTAATPPLRAAAATLVDRFDSVCDAGTRRADAHGMQLLRIGHSSAS